MSGGNAGAGHAQMYTMGAFLKHGNEEQKRRFLPDIASGAKRLQAFGITEPTAGSDTTSITTVAERKGDKYIINGQKIWTSRAEYSDLMMILARTTPKDKLQKKTDGLSLFILDMKEQADKLTIRPIVQ
jgi:acyl-CoA dehydrogenase